MKKVTALLPGTCLALLIALCAVYLEYLLPVHLIGASVIALFIGMILVVHPVSI